MIMMPYGRCWSSPQLTGTQTSGTPHAYPRRPAARRPPAQSCVRASRPSPTTTRTATRSASSRSPAERPPARPAPPPARSPRHSPPAAPPPAPRPARRGHASNRHQHPHRSPAQARNSAHITTPATSRTKPGVSRPRRPAPRDHRLLTLAESGLRTLPISRREWRPGDYAILIVSVGNSRHVMSHQPQSFTRRLFQSFECRRTGHSSMRGWGHSR
jgi:hypothetical protein